MRRGHVYRLTAGGGPVEVLVISDDMVNDHIGGATAVQIYPREAVAPSILAIPVQRPAPGLIVVDRFATYAAKFFTDDLGPVGAEELEAVEVGLRTVFDL